MDDLLLIDWQTRALGAAAGKGDWESVASLDREIAGLLQTLGSQPLTEQKRHELLKLQRTHQQVLKLAQHSSQQLQQKMAQLREQREGAQAYSAFMDEDNFRNE
ncbi:MAG: flagellar protein FliT [Silvania sp.]|uniref:flagellar protein FliT n=1 Tax=Silvania sp. TaxID=3016633 RepID=UPI003EE7B05B